MQEQVENVQIQVDRRQDVLLCGRGKSEKERVSYFIMLRVGVADTDRLADRWVPGEQSELTDFD